MVTSTDHIENLRNRIFDKLKENEREHQELSEMLRVLAAVPKVLEGKATHVARSEDTENRPPTKYNMNLGKLVDEYIAEYKWDEIVNIPTMIKTLKEEKGVRGKDKSLYAYIHALLRERAKKPDSVLKYKAGAGFYKTRKEDKDATLVASV